MRVSELISDFEIWASNEELKLLEKLQKPIRLSSLDEHDQVNVQNMIRKSLITKIGQHDPIVVINEKINPTKNK